MISRKPLAVPMRTHVQEFEAVTAVPESVSKAPEQRRVRLNVTANSPGGDAPFNTQKNPEGSKRGFLCFISAGSHAGPGSHTSHTYKRTLSLKEHFSHTLSTLSTNTSIKHFHNHISHCTLLIMIGFTSASLVALIVGLAAGLPTTDKHVFPQCGRVFSLQRPPRYCICFLLRELKKLHTDARTWTRRCRAT
jgi:hypothetical protein